MIKLIRCVLNWFRIFKIVGVQDKEDQLIASGVVAIGLLGLLVIIVFVQLAERVF